MRTVNFHVTRGAIIVLSVEVVLGASWLNSANVMRHAVTCQTELTDSIKPQ